MIGEKNLIPTRAWPRTIVALILGACLCSTSVAQDVNRVGSGAYGVVYRPPGTDYQTVEREHFQLIYETGAEDMARRTIRALEATWPNTESLVGPGTSDLDMPVVINNFNDRSNGFVHAFPFRQEIEAPSIKSDALVARSSSWPALVAPHELVHAAHAEVHSGIGLGGLVRPFAPDIVRGMNLMAPRGLVEGVAVYRESRIEPGAGRLNAPLFQMKMKAALLSDDPWSLTQMLERPAYTQPYNRFYIGGAHAFEYLAERGDSVRTDFFQSTVAWHNRLPVFGHGVWLGLSTGQFPFQLRNEIQSELRQDYQEELDRRKPFSASKLIAGEQGRNHRRPYWLDDETLVAYVHGYDVRPGFYRIDARTGDRQTIRVQELTEDRVYSIGKDTSALYAGRYVQDPLVPRQEIAEVERIDLVEGTATRLTDGGRAFAPVEGPGGTVHAITNDGPFTQWSVVTDAESTRVLTPEAPRSIRQIAPSPRDSTVAVLVNENGRQFLYRAPDSLGASVQLTPWIGLWDAIIYDVSWGPEGRYLLFSADLRGSPNAFAYDVETEQVLQLTNVRFGAIEPTLSPDRSTLAFVNYRHERHDLVRTDFQPDSATVVPDSLIFRGPSVPTHDETQDVVHESGTVSLSDVQSYSSWRHLLPRMVYPTLHGDGREEPATYFQESERGPLGFGMGIGMQGADPLQGWAYQGTTYWQNGRLWGEGRIQSGAFLLRPSVSVYDRAFSTLARVDGRQVSLAVEERGGNIGVRLPVTLQSNVYRSFLRVGMDGEIRQTRFLNIGSAPRAYTTRVTLSPEAVIGYRVQQNPRDVVPNTGTVLGIQGEFDAWTDAGTRSEGLVASLDTYAPSLQSSHTGIRLGGRMLFQNRASIFDTGTFVPRGHSSFNRLPSGPFLQLEVEITQPVWYIDDGLTLLPFYAKALSLYGFGEVLGSVDGGHWRRALSSVGAGLSLETRVFYGFNLDLRIGAAYRPETEDIVTIYR